MMLMQPWCTWDIWGSSQPMDHASFHEHTWMGCWRKVCWWGIQGFHSLGMRECRYVFLRSIPGRSAGTLHILPDHPSPWVHHPMRIPSHGCWREDQNIREKTSLSALTGRNFLCQICRNKSYKSTLVSHGWRPHHPGLRTETPTLKHHKVPPTQLLSHLKPPESSAEASWSLSPVVNGGN